MTLTDTAATTQLPAAPLLTTWPCSTEAMYLLFRAGGHQGQAALWSWHLAGKLVLHEPKPDELPRMAALMEKYRDQPMDLADASLVSAADALGQRLLFTLDSDFHVYRLLGGETFEIVPR